MDILEALKNSDSDTAVALVNGKVLTAGELLNEIGRWKSFFESGQINSAVLFCSDRIRFTAALIGAWCAGTRTVLPTDMTQFTRQRLENEGHFFIFDDTPEVNREAISPAEDLRLTPDEHLVEMFTSGSTGEPTRVLKTLTQVLSDIDTLDADFPVKPRKGAIVFSTVSHQHIYGFLWTVLWPLSSGRLLTQERLVFPESIHQALKENTPVILISSPAHLKRLPLDLNWAEVREHLDCLVSSGGPLSEEGLGLCQEAFGQTPFEILGSTELDGIAWRQRRFCADKTIDSDSCRWHPMPGTLIGKNDEGILQVKSSRLDPLHWTTGNDRIETLEDGTFTLLGRTDRIVKIEEKRLSLTAMEQEIIDSGYCTEARAFVLPKSNELAVVAVPSKTGQEKLLSGKWGLIKAIEGRLRKRFEAVLLPHRWRFEPMMPTNSQGKYTLKSLEDLFDPRHIEPFAWEMERNRFVLRFKANPKLPYFEGHFPEWPILPGVAQVQMVLTEAARYLKTPLSVSCVSNLKFMSLIHPGTDLVMQADFDTEQLKLKYRMTSPDGKRQYSCASIAFKR